MVDQAIAAGTGDGRPDRSGVQVGEDVVHGKWGEGVVLDLSGSGDKTRSHPLPTVGQKVLLLAGRAEEGRDRATDPVAIEVAVG